MKFLNFLEKFPTVMTGWRHHNGYLCFLCSAAFYFWSSLITFQLLRLVVFIVGVLNFLVLCSCASVGCNVKCMSFAHVLHYLAGAVAPDLPVWKPLQPVFLVVNAIFVSFRLLHGIFALPKF